MGATLAQREAQREDPSKAQTNSADAAWVPTTVEGAIAEEATGSPASTKATGQCRSRRRHSRVLASHCLSPRAKSVAESQATEASKARRRHLMAQLTGEEVDALLMREVLMQAHGAVPVCGPLLAPHPLAVFRAMVGPLMVGPLNGVGAPRLLPFVALHRTWQRASAWYLFLPRRTAMRAMVVTEGATNPGLLLVRRGRSCRPCSSMVVMLRASQKVWAQRELQSMSATALSCLCLMERVQIPRRSWVLFVLAVLDNCEGAARTGLH